MRGRTGDLRRTPIVVAPMAGGPSTPALVLAAAEAGALGFLAGGYKSAASMHAEMRAVRAATELPFGVNVFVPGGPQADREQLEAYTRSLAAEAESIGSSVGAPIWTDDGWEQKLAILIADAPAVASFTFGCPAAEVIGALRAAGSTVMVTVTTPEEAAAAGAAGADCLGVQGFEAGAHRGSFGNDDRPGQDFGLLSLISEVARVSDLPMVAAGGIAGRRGVAAVLAAGATCAQLGTIFLRCPESGAKPAYKAALADPRFSETAITRAFSGRRARSLVNRFVLEHADAPAAYPQVNNATGPLRAAAADAGDAEHMSLYAGQGFRSASTRAAGEIIEELLSAAAAPHA